MEVLAEMVVEGIPRHAFTVHQLRLLQNSDLKVFLFFTIHKLVDLAGHSCLLVLDDLLDSWTSHQALVPVKAVG